LAVVEKNGASVPLASLFLGHDDVVIAVFPTVAELLQLVDSHQVDAVLLDPELPEGWPATVAEQLVEGVNDRVPVLIACRSAADAQVIGDRLAGEWVFVMQRERLNPQAIVQLFAGANATRRTKPSAT
jgi:CheY-like chemotaxis protein